MAEYPDGLCECLGNLLVLTEKRAVIKNELRETAWYQYGRKRRLNQELSRLQDQASDLGNLLMKETAKNIGNKYFQEVMRAWQRS